MRKLFLILSIFSLLIIFSPNISLAQSDETIVVKKSTLTPDQIAKAEADKQNQAIQDKLKNMSDYARWGHEVGVGMDEALGAVEKHVEKFGRTDVGHFTMFIIAWKFMANDVLTQAPKLASKVIGWLVGIPFFFLACISLLLSYRRLCVPHRILIKKSKEGEKEWEMYDPDKNRGNDKWNKDDWAIAHGVMFVIVFIIFILITFA